VYRDLRAAVAVSAHYEEHLSGPVIKTAPVPTSGTMLYDIAPPLSRWQFLMTALRLYSQEGSR
jgi:hypothetical protein